MNAAGRSFLWATHYCGLKRPTGGCGAPSRHASSLRRNPSLFGLAPCGVALPAALLRRRCALTAPFHPYLSLAARAVCFLWHFPSNRLQPAVPDVIRPLLCGVRTFLVLCLATATVRSGANYFIIVHAEVQAESLAGRQLALTPAVSVQAAADTAAGPRRSTAESARQDKTGSSRTSHAEAP